MLHVIKDFGAVNLEDVTAVVACSRPITREDGSILGPTEVGKSPTLAVYLRGQQYAILIPCASKEDAQAEGNRLIQARNRLGKAEMVTTPKGDGIRADRIQWVGVVSRSRMSVQTFAVVIEDGTDPAMEFATYDDRDSAERERDRIIDEINGA